MSVEPSRIVVGVATHKAYRMPSDPCYLPIQVGAALHPGLDLGFQRDDEGENISGLNASYCELTGLFWLWRNVNADAKGLVHYRRLLGSPNAFRRWSRDSYGRLATADEFASLLLERPVVLARRRNYYIETVYNHYSHTFDGAQFDACRAALRDRWPEYVPAWDGLMCSRGAHIFNMFVMRAPEFNAYCAWLFDVLAEVERRYDGSGFDAFDARWPGRVSERLLDPWLQTNDIAFVELPVVSPELVDWPAKAKGFLAAKFLGKKYERSF